MSDSPEDPSPQKSGVADRTWIRVLALLAIVLCLLQLIRAYYLRTEYYDGYDNVSNARFLLGEGLLFYHFRTPLPYLVLVPVMWLKKCGLFSDPFLGLRGLFLLLFALSVVLHHKLLRNYGLSSAAAWLTGLLVFASPLCLHYAPCAVPANTVLLVTPLSFLFVLGLHRKPGISLAILTGIVIGIATLARFQMVFLGPAIALFWLVSKPPALSRRQSLGYMLLFGVTALLVWNGVFWLVHKVGQVGDRHPLIAGIQICLEYKSKLPTFNEGLIRSRTFYFEVIFANFGAFGSMFILAGIGLAVAQRRVIDKLMLCGFAVYLLANIFIPNYEARYAVTMFTFFAYFIGLSVDFLLKTAARSKTRFWLAHGLLLLSLIACGVKAWPEMNSWRHPFYRHGFGPELAAKVKSYKTDKELSILWVGAFHADYPPFGPLHPIDRFHQIYHFGHKALEYHLPQGEGYRYSSVSSLADVNILSLPKRALVIEISKQSPTNYNRLAAPAPVSLIEVTRTAFKVGDNGAVNLVKEGPGIVIRTKPGGRSPAYVTYTVDGKPGNKTWPTVGDTLVIPQRAVGIEGIMIRTEIWHKP
jgi:hypothetical protein